MNIKNSRNHVTKPYAINGAISLIIFCVQKTSMELIASIPAKINAARIQASSPIPIAFTHQTSEPALALLGWKDGSLKGETRYTKIMSATVTTIRDTKLASEKRLKTISLYLMNNTKPS